VCVAVCAAVRVAVRVAVFHHATFFYFVAAVCGAVCYGDFKGVAVRNRVFPYCCRLFSLLCAMQCVAVCCSVLQCVAAGCMMHSLM